MSSVRKFAVHCVILGWLPLAGCARGDQATLSRATAQESYGAGLQALEGREFARADELLSAAIGAGGLQPDAYGDALIKRAIAQAHLGQYEAAHAALDRAEPGAPDLASVHAARSFVFKRQGNEESAGREFAQAKALNPRVQEIRP